MNSFINDEKILSIIENTKFSESKAEEIIQKALALKGLGLEEAAMLLSCPDDEYLDKIFAAAGKVKSLIYGRRLVFFAPLYISSFCVNNCLYCGFRRDNKDIARRRLSIAEVLKEVNLLESFGHKRLLVVAAEDKDINADYLSEVISAIYAAKNGRGEIRRVNINCAPLDLQGFKKLKKCGIGTYQLFQETYHNNTYNKMHPCGPKSDFMKRLYAMDTAQEAGIDDVGIGALFGLYDFRFEVLSLLEHCRYLEDKFGAGPHTISVPRIEPALNSLVSDNPPYAVSDIDFKKIIAVLRLAVPYTGLILSTREKSSLRNELLYLGISQVSAGSRTNPGGYSSSGDGQFCLGDNRTLKEVVMDAAEAGFIASFCTACYRNKRTGADFMKLAKPGHIQEFCLSNAILTLKEYLLDYTDNGQNKASALLDAEAANIKDGNMRKITLGRLKRLERGERDLYF